MCQAPIAIPRKSRKPPRYVISSSTNSLANILFNAIFNPVSKNKQTVRRLHNLRLQLSFFNSSFSVPKIQLCDVFAFGFETELRAKLVAPRERWKVKSHEMKALVQDFETLKFNTCEKREIIFMCSSETLNNFLQSIAAVKRFTDDHKSRLKVSCVCCHS